MVSIERQSVRLYPLSGRASYSDRQADRYFFASETGTFGPGFEFACSLELASAGDSASFGCATGGYCASSDTPVIVWALLPPPGLVVLVPQPTNIPQAKTAIKPAVRKNIFLIID
jgi:hypothetical protein